VADAPACGVSLCANTRLRKRKRAPQLKTVPRTVRFAFRKTDLDIAAILYFVARRAKNPQLRIPPAANSLA
jgi:hypothetical protein